MRNRWLLRLTVILLAAVAVLSGFRPAARAWEHWERARWRAKVFAAYQKGPKEEIPPMGDFREVEKEGDEEEDDPLLRRLYSESYYGTFGPDVSNQIFRAAQREAARIPRNTAIVAGQSWVNLGPTDARIQINGAQYNGIDSGRAATIRVDPRDKDVVYLATASGGVWKSYDFTGAQPHWIPITDTVGSGFVGAFDLDPSNPDTLWMGLGDALDTTIAGGSVFKSTDGGASWKLMTAGLAGTYAAGAGARPERAVSVRDLAVDPSDGNHVLVTTEVGLFRTTDGGTTWALAQLPTNGGGTVDLESATWTIQYLGAAAGKSAWLVSGINACVTNTMAPGFGAEQPPGAATCARGTLGDLWRSSDSGATWTSLRNNAKLPTSASLGAEFARMAIAAGAPTNPDATVVYAQVGKADTSANSSQLAVFKSTDGGKTFTTVATATTTVTNPTTGTNCKDMNVAHGQAWYNLAIGVDPTNSNHVLLGGNLCGVRSIDGGTTWQNVSHWLAGAVAGGTLPYVHADWHAVTIVNIGGVVRTFAGSDGGIFSATNVFTAATGQQVNWSYTVNRGIPTHLFYGISSGDPTKGDEQVIFGGLQDNGTRFRDLDPTLGTPTGFNQVVGGDGIGTALVRPTGVNGGVVYFGSLPSQRTVCQDTAVHCSQGTGWAGALSFANGTTDPEPFFMRYSPVEEDTTGAVLTSTTYHVFKMFYSGTTLSSTRLTDPAVAGTPGPLGGIVRNVFAAAPIYKDAANVSFRVYGAALSGGKFAVGIEKGATTAWTVATAALGIGTDPTQRLTNTTSMAFPSNAKNFAATATDGQVYVAGSTAPRMADLTTVVPDAIGRIFITVDGGASYKPFHGKGTSDLPNVPVQAIVFDPSDTTDKTIFVGNDLGVYQTTDGGDTWHRYGVGFPMVRVSEIRIAKNSGVMRVGTYGRGLWEIYPNKNAAAGVRGDGDWDRNLAIDFLDLGATASRLGGTPETAAQPYYDWHLDVTGTSNSVDESDLTALVGKFGSHP
ncbi:MAG: hypothetical protein JWN44_5794 [Myxococcales bacterium]|nr:hypothetical protein [Myxococcales bacterium]